MAIITFVTITAMIAVVAYLLAYIMQARPIPPYQEQVKCTQDCRQGRDCDCFKQSCELDVAEYDKTGKPIAAWPFPTQPKP